MLFGCLCALLIMSIPQSARSQDARKDGVSGRPRVGLVLAGGGAKGGAHVGVLKVLEELQVPIDCIAGTSMGALVGGGYASGIPAAELEKFLVGIKWDEVVGGQGRRDLEPIGQKRDGATYSNTLELGLRPGRRRGHRVAWSTRAVSKTCCAASSRARGSNQFRPAAHPLPRRCHRYGLGTDGRPRTKAISRPQCEQAWRSRRIRTRRHR